VPSCPPLRRRLARQLRLAALTGVALLLALALIRTLPHPPLSSHAPQSVAVQDRHGKLLRLTLASDDRYRLWLPLAEISPRLVEAVLLHEDAWFRWHPGVNPLSLVRGAWSTYVSGEARIGGSTLTMQLARLLGRLDTRSPAGKLRQIGQALWLEARYSKDEILEAYLNLAPYGGNIEGVGAASLIYFDKPARELTLPEALTLAVLPQAPARRGKPAADGAGQVIGPALAAARDRLYQRFRGRGSADASDDALMALPLRLRPASALPFAAPHLVERVLAERWRRSLAGPQLRTTLELSLQRLVEQRVASHLARWRSKGLDNAVVMLVDTRDMGVRALVGSADYFDPKIGGQVNGAAGKRSPGSTLKPFIYGLALDQGVLHPASVLRDVPSAFGPFTPENFDGRFLGPVTATEALVRSRNIPAVLVAAQLRRPSLYDFLRQAGIARMASAEHYGLALVLGGGEVTMEELVQLYALLGNDGQWKPLNFIDGLPLPAGKPLLTAEAAFIVRDMLAQNPRPDFGTLAQTNALRVPWKTGTSWGFRDAWSAGLVGPYALVVWMGHFDGRGNPALIGVDAAAPLFFSIVDALAAAHVDLSDPPRRWPLNLRRVEVCRASGDLPNVWCPKRGDTWFIPGVSPIRQSRIHRAIQVDRVTGQPVCGRRDPATVRTEVYEFWPSDLAEVYAQAGIPRRKPPKGADCAGAEHWLGSAPTISSPLRATAYALRLSRPDQNQIELQASADADAARLFWFAGSSFIGEAAPGQSLPWTPPRAGRHSLRVVDDHGRVAEREVEVMVGSHRTCRNLMI
jgi:penicillin-binding protein 1C